MTRLMYALYMTKDRLVRKGDVSPNQILGKVLISDYVNCVGNLYVRFLIVH